MTTARRVELATDIMGDPEEFVFLHPVLAQRFPPYRPPFRRRARPPPETRGVGEFKSLEVGLRQVEPALEQACYEVRACVPSI